MTEAVCGHQFVRGPPKDYILTSLVPFQKVILEKKINLIVGGNMINLLKMAIADILDNGVGHGTLDTIC